MWRSDFKATAGSRPESIKHFLAVHNTTGTVNRDIFIRGDLLPELLPFNGSIPCSITVVDNYWAIHHVEDVIWKYRF